MTTELSDRDRRTLLDFMEFAATGSRLVDRGRAAYDEDEMLRLAGEAILHRIGEAVARLSDELVEEHTEINWRPMRGMRNIVAHEYGVVDHRLIWTAMERDLPTEAEGVRRILDGQAE